ncbi:MAG: hypothetical protein K2M82_06685 [Lachnospiraceae bacterium]|nr:hypothetical protein [Lachnospiraceae bacterium]
MEDVKKIPKKKSKKKTKRSKKKARIVKYMPSFVFSFFIFAVAIMYVALPMSDYSELEKRSLSEMPEVTAENVLNGTFGQKFETYLADHMPMRTFWVGANSYYDMYSGRNGSNGVYKGEDGFLFAVPVNYSTTLDSNVEYIDEFARSVNLPTYMCIIPSAGYIMGDKLPSRHYEYNDDALIDVVKYDLNELNSNIKYVDVVQDFKLKADSEQLYYKTDHHWTSLGAYECYTTLGRSLGYTPTPKNKFKVEKYYNFYGTSYGKAGLWDNDGESIELWKNAEHTKTNITVTIAENGEVTSTNSMFFMDNMYSDDQYTTFLDGNHGLVTITNSYVENDKRLLVLRDSYTHCLAPFLADNYSEIVLVDLRYYKGTVSDLVKTENIDQILALYSLDSIINSTDIAYLL